MSIHLLQNNKINEIIIFIFRKCSFIYICTKLFARKAQVIKTYPGEIKEEYFIVPTTKYLKTRKIYS